MYWEWVPSLDHFRGGDEMSSPDREATDVGREAIADVAGGIKRAAGTGFTGRGARPAWFAA